MDMASAQASMSAGACEDTPVADATKYMTKVVPKIQATMLISGMSSRRALRSTHAKMRKASGAVAVETLIVSSTPSSAAAKTSGSETMVTSRLGRGCAST